MERKKRGRTCQASELRSQQRCKTAGHCAGRGWLVARVTLGQCPEMSAGVRTCVHACMHVLECGPGGGGRGGLREGRRLGFCHILCHTDRSEIMTQSQHLLFAVPLLELPSSPGCWTKATEALWVLLLAKWHRVPFMAHGQSPEHCPVHISLVTSLMVVSFPDSCNHLQ